MRTLVTGASGFVGRHLLPRLIAAGDTVLGLGLDPENGASPPPGASWERLDILDAPALAARVADFRPDRVLHLAGQSAQGHALADPAPSARVNVLGTLHLLEALRRGAPTARLLVASSGEVYGSPGPEPVGEEAPVAPVNPYGASKAAMEVLVGQAARAWGARAVIARSFPHVGPGQRPDFALPAFARQVARIETGRQQPQLRVGNLEARRDFLDVEDVVAAYLLLLDPALAVPPGEVYNVCSGRARSIREGLEGLIALARVPGGGRIAVETDPALLRPVDQPVLHGRPDKLKAATGWSPRYDFPTLLERVLADWRRRTAEERA
ncbi:NAD-dependent epimerase/dehydratase family protein [bacterium]|nr:NAD-dependent epimerase/dehydratase family protein [bacterium]